MSYPSVLLLSLVFFISFLPACRKGAEAEMEDKVQEVCACFDPVMRFEEFSKMAITIEDTVRLARLAEEYEKIEQISEKCRERWRKLIDGREEAQRQQYQQALEDRCFDVAKMLEIAE